MTAFRRLLIEDDGLEVVEFAILIGLVAVGTIALLGAIGAFVTGAFASVSDNLGGD